MDASEHPPNWPEISIRVRTEAGMRCEWCGVANYAVGARDTAGKWWRAELIEQAPPELVQRWFGMVTPATTRIVLTVAHLDHDTANNARKNLAALCQRCHLGHDREQHQRSAAKTRQRQREEAVAATGQQRLW